MANDHHSTIGRHEREAIREDGERNLRRVMSNIDNGAAVSRMRERMEKASLILSKALAIMALAESQGLDQVGDMESVFAVIDDLVRRGKASLDHATGEAIAQEISLSTQEEAAPSSLESGAILKALADWQAAQASLAAVNASCQEEADSDLVSGACAQLEAAAERVFSSPSRSRADLMRKFAIAEAIAEDANDVVPDKNHFPVIISSLKLDVMRLQSS